MPLYLFGRRWLSGSDFFCFICFLFALWNTIVTTLVWTNYPDFQGGCPQHLALPLGVITIFGVADFTLLTIFTLRRRIFEPSTRNKPVVACLYFAVIQNVALLICGIVAVVELVKDDFPADLTDLRTTVLKIGFIEILILPPILFLFNFIARNLDSDYYLDPFESNGFELDFVLAFAIVVAEFSAILRGSKTISTLVVLSLLVIYVSFRLMFGSWADPMNKIIILSSSFQIVLIVIMTAVFGFEEVFDQIPFQVTMLGLARLGNNLTALVLMYLPKTSKQRKHPHGDPHDDDQVCSDVTTERHVPVTPESLTQMHSGDTQMPHYSGIFLTLHNLSATVSRYFAPPTPTNEDVNNSNNQPSQLQNLPNSNNQPATPASGSVTGRSAESEVGHY